MSKSHELHRNHPHYSVPEAVVKHPWWKGSAVCYDQVIGWAWGDSQCILEWPSKTFLTCPNWIEHTAFVVLPLAAYTQKPVAGLVVGGAVILLEHMIKTISYLPAAMKECNGRGMWHTLFVALGAGTVLSAQEVTRVQALIHRLSFYSLCRRVDWFDGQQPRIRLDIQFGSMFRYAISNIGITCLGFGSMNK